MKRRDAGRELGLQAPANDAKQGYRAQDEGMTYSNKIDVGV